MPSDKKARYIVEGEWSGYVSRQRRVVHREIVSKTRADKLRNLSAIRYTDGTTLNISVREAGYRERVQEINGYGRLIKQAEATGKSYVNVRELPDAK